MIRPSYPLIILLLAALAGCGGSAESQTPINQAPAAAAAGASAPSPALSTTDAPMEPWEKEASQRKGYQVLRTDDVRQWPTIKMPLEIEIKLPPIPEKITKPSPPSKESAAGK